MRAPDAPMNPKHVAFGVALLVAWCASVWNVHMFTTDDAWISARHALRLAEGDGPVWNVGGPPNEGHSNPLLVLLEAGVYRIGQDGMEFARALGVLAGAATVFATWFLGRAIVGNAAGAAAAAIVALTPALAYWSVSGLETLPATLLVTAATLCFARAEPRSDRVGAFLAAALVWLRPEAPVLALPALLLREIPALLDPGRRTAALSRLAGPLAIVVASIAALEALRWHWYGHWLPNSVIFKAGTGTTGSVTKKFLLQAWPLLPFAVLGMATLRGNARILAIPPLVALAGSPFFLNSVNDYSRLLLPCWPLWALLAAVGLHRIFARWLAPSVALLAVVLAMLPSASFTTVGDLARRYTTCKTRSREAVADYLAAHMKPGDVYAIGDAGLVPFRADGQALDTFGLNDPDIQRDGPWTPRQRARKVFAARPEWIVAASKEPDTFVGKYAEERAMVSRKEFQSYHLAEVFPGRVCPYNLFLYRRAAP